MPDTPQSCVPPLSTLVAWWRAEGNANNQSGAHNGTAWNGVTYPSGEVGLTFHLNGTTGHVRVANSPALRFTNGMTLEAWVNPLTNVPTTGAGVIANWDMVLGINQRAFALCLGPNGNPILSLSSDGGCVHVVAVSGTNSVPLSTWTHLAGTYDGANVMVYINGVLSGIAPWTLGIFPGTNDLALGGGVGGLSPGQVGSALPGSIDEASVYNRALAASDILNIYNAGNLGKCSNAPPSITTQPASQTVPPGGAAAFSVLASGTPPLGYQWTFDGTAISGATAGAYAIQSAQATNAGTYTVTVSNAFGTAVSSNATLTVTGAPPCFHSPSGQVAWWRAEYDATDQLGAHNGTAYGGLTYGLGEVGYTLVLDGTNGHVRVPNSPALRFTNAMTIEAWVNPAAYVPVTGAGVIANWDLVLGINQRAFALCLQPNGTPALSLSSDGGYGNVVAVSGTNSVPLGTWTHLAGTYDGANAKGVRQRRS